MKSSAAFSLKRWILIAVFVLPMAGMLPACGGGSAVTSTTASAVTAIAADSAIVGVKTIGTIAADGAKLAAIAVEYNVDMTGADVKAASYALDTWNTTWTTNSINFGSGNIGDITRIYVNDQPVVSAVGGSGKGRYVIIEVYQDYLHAGEQNVLRALSAGVTQVGTIRTASHTIAPGASAVLNYTAGQTGAARTAQTGSYTVKGIDGYQYYTNTPGVYGAAGPAFTAANCFAEDTGKYTSVDMDYALFVPADYDAAKKYALVTVNHPAFSAGTHPFQAVTTSRGATVMASDWAQQIVKTKHGLAGLIVVVPVYTQRLGDNGGTTANYSALVKLWDDLQQRYSISPDHIYGAGQSVGGMMILETNVRRDNYFAGILMYDNQWGQNYYKDEVFARGMTDPIYTETTANTPRYYPATDDTVWTYHWGSDGSRVYDGHDNNNYYYLTSDDNVMVMNSSENYLSNNLWMEQNHLYKDLVDYEIPRLWIMNPKAAQSEQETQLRNYLAQPNRHNGTDRGLHWVTFQGGSSQITPVWSRRLDTAYEWLLSQTRSTEMARGKLDLNKPFELASVQRSGRVMPNFVDPKTNGTISYLTGKSGSGTRFYNTSWLRIGTNVTADQIPGWLPTGMAHAVAAAGIQSVTPINNGGRLVAVALRYNVDMSGAVVHVKGDAVLSSKGIARTDDVIALDSFDFYDNTGAKISGTITNVYANSTAARVDGAARGSGSGTYLIVEIDSAWSGVSMAAVQRATVRTATAIASASPVLH